MNFEKVIAVRTSKTIYLDKGKAIKVFDSDYSKANILNEALNHARVEESQLNIPKLLEVGMVDGKWAITTEYIKGKTLQQIMDENPERLAEFLEKFVDLQMLVHAQNVPMLNKLKDKMSRKISETDLDATTRYDLQTRLEGMPKHNKLCHGDFNPSNIIIADDGKAYILDWSHATRGNASADVARTYLLLWLAGKLDLAEEYLSLFCKKANVAKQYVEKWMPIVAASQSVKGKAEEKQFLLHWVDVVDYQ